MSYRQSAFTEWRCLPQVAERGRRIGRESRTLQEFGRVRSGLLRVKRRTEKIANRVCRGSLRCRRISMRAHLGMDRPAFLLGCANCSGVMHLAALLHASLQPNDRLSLRGSGPGRAALFGIAIAKVVTFPRIPHPC